MRGAEGKAPISLDMQMNFGGDLCRIGSEDILLDLIPSGNKDASQENGFVATFKPVPAIDGGSKAADDEDSRPSKKPRKSDAAQAGTQWQTISANGGADGAVLRAEKVILVAVKANETESGRNEAEAFANKLRSTHSGSTKPVPKKKAERMETAIVKKLEDMVTIEGDTIRVNRKKFRGIFRTKTHRQGYNCFTRFLLGNHYVENENGDNDCDAVDGDTTESCIVELVERTKKIGRMSGSLKYSKDSLDALVFTRVP